MCVTRGVLSYFRENLHNLCISLKILGCSIITPNNQIYVSALCEDEKEMLEELLRLYI